MIAKFPGRHRRTTNNAMAKLSSLQHFSSVAALASYHGITMPRPNDWRLLSPALVGSINGLPTSQGTAVATNGILVAIVQAGGLFFGHFAFFVADEQAEERVNNTKTRKLKQVVDIMEFV